MKNLNGNTWGCVLVILLFAVTALLIACVVKV